MSRSRAWCYTLNNFTEEDRDAQRCLQCVYQVFGYERGEEGTPHLQGYVHFASAKTMSAVSKLMPRAHLEARKGTVDQAVDYCKKDGDYEEFGEKPMSQKEKGEANKQRWKRILEKAQEGDEEWLEENEPDVAFASMAKFRSHKKMRVEVMGYEDTPHEWWVGPTGTGKSRQLWSLYPTHYGKSLSKWWDGYRGEEVVACEEWAPKNECTASFLKVWADRYPFKPEIKGAFMKNIRPAKVIVLSNYTIEQCFPNPEDSEPLRRRFKVVNFQGGPLPEAWARTCTPKI